MIQKSMFEIKCADCGKTAMVSFKPKIGKPAYCRACLSKHMFKRSESVGRNSSFDPNQAWARRRGGGQEKKENEHTRLFQWSYFVHGKEAI